MGNLRSLASLILFFFFLKLKMLNMRFYINIVNIINKSLIKNVFSLKSGGILFCTGHPSLKTGGCIYTPIPRDLRNEHIGIPP